MIRLVTVAVPLSGCSDQVPLTAPAQITDRHLDEDCDVFDVCDCNRCNARNRHVHVSLSPGGPCTTNACAGQRAVCVRGTCEVESR